MKLRELIETLDPNTKVNIHSGDSITFFTGIIKQFNPTEYHLNQEVYSIYYVGRCHMTNILVSH